MPLPPAVMSATFSTDILVSVSRWGSGSSRFLAAIQRLFEQVVVAVGSPLLIEKLGRPEEGMNLMRYPLLHDAHNFWPQFLDRAFPQGASAPTR